MAGLNDFCSGLCESGASRKLSPVWYFSTLSGSEKAGKRICADPMIYC